MQGILKKYTEPFIWTAALVLLYFMEPSADGYSLCLLKALGANWCPGCGLGHSIHYALHLNFTASAEEHILGIPAVAILIYQVFKSVYLTHKISNNGSAKNIYDVPGHGLRRTV